MKVIAYAPWIPQAGMARTFQELTAAWGSPDSWDANVRALVCERGAPLEVRFDKHLASSHYYYVSPSLRIEYEPWK